MLFDVCGSTLPSNDIAGSQRAVEQHTRCRLNKSR
jgi:hypothetical protein